MSDSNILQTHRIGIGNTLTPLGVVLQQGGRAVDLQSKTVKVIGKTSAAAEWIAETITGVTAEAAQVVTLAGDGTITLARHGFPMHAEVRFTTAGSLPDGLVVGQNYWVINSRPDTFQISTYPGGQAITFSGGSGVHSVVRVGSVAYDFQAADVDAAGTFSIYFNVYSGSEFDTFPNDGRKFEVEVKATT